MYWAQHSSGKKGEHCVLLMFDQMQTQRKAHVSWKVRALLWAQERHFFFLKFFETSRVLRTMGHERLWGTQCFIRNESKFVAKSLAQLAANSVFWSHTKLGYSGRTLSVSQASLDEENFTGYVWKLFVVQFVHWPEPEWIEQQANSIVPMPPRGPGSFALDISVISELGKNRFEKWNRSVLKRVIYPR